MKKLLLTSVAALFLATGTANAGMCSLWQCGKIKVQACAIHEWNGGGYEVNFSDLKKPITGRFRRRENGDGSYTASLNGKRCKELDI